MATTKRKPGGFNPAKGSTRKAGIRPDGITNADRRGDEVYAQLYGATKAVDEIARTMEAKWGRLRLPTLVSPETAAKFHAVEERFNSAIDRYDLEGVKREAAILWRGWHALDQEAERLGAEKRPSRVWEIEGEGEDLGKTFRIVLTDEDKHGLAAELPSVPGEEVLILSVEELLRIFRIDRFAIARAALEAFPGAVMTTSTRDLPRKPSEVEDLVDDEIPF